VHGIDKGRSMKFICTALLEIEKCLKVVIGRWGRAEKSGKDDFL